MTLCGNRPEGFGPKSTISPTVPTTCFIDTILLPLPIWIALLLLPILFALSLHSRKSNYNPSTAYLRTKFDSTWVFTTTKTIYYLFILANILMQTLEIVRLELIHFGVGLLPFVYVGLILGAVLHWTQGVGGRIKGWHAINAVIWLGGIAMCVLKCVGLTAKGVDAMKDTKYPTGDQETDVAVMAGVYAVIAIFEVVLAVWRSKKSKRSSAESVESDEGRDIWTGKS